MAEKIALRPALPADSAALAADDRSALRDAFEAVLAMVDVVGVGVGAGRPVLGVAAPVAVVRSVPRQVLNALLVAAKTMP